MKSKSGLLASLDIEAAACNSFWQKSIHKINICHWVEKYFILYGNFNKKGMLITCGLKVHVGAAAAGPPAFDLFTSAGRQKSNPNIYKLFKKMN